MSQRITLAAKRTIIQLWKKGLSKVEIADKLGYAFSTVDAAIERPPEVVSKTRTQSPGTVAKRKRACWLRAQGWTLDRIEIATGIRAEDVEANWKKWADKYGIKLPDPKPEPPDSDYNSEIITYRMVDGQLIEIGREPFRGTAPEGGGMEEFEDYCFYAEEEEN